MAKFAKFSFPLLLWTGLAAQTPTGTISGTLKDQSGGFVSNAAVTVTNKDTGAVRNLAANAEGLYSAPVLSPGDYEIRVEAPGFRTLVRPATVVAGSTTTADLTLSLGTTQEVVTVEAATAHI